jgi:hypothetical protein
MDAAAPSNPPVGSNGAIETPRRQVEQRLFSPPPRSGGSIPVLFIPRPLKSLKYIRFKWNNGGADEDVPALLFRFLKRTYTARRRELSPFHHRIDF